jgi:hypothetical protein
MDRKISNFKGLRQAKKILAALHGGLALKTAFDYALPPSV